MRNLEPMRCVAIAVDLQNGFLDPCTRDVVGPATRFTADLIGFGVPVFASRFANTVDSQWAVLLPWSGSISAEECRLVPGIEELVAPERVFDKQSYTSFSPVVRQYAENTGANTVLIYGFTTESCVLATAFHVFDLGYRPIVVSDCVAGAYNAPHSGRDSLNHIGYVIGDTQVLSSDQVIQRLEYRFT